VQGAFELSAAWLGWVISTIAFVTSLLAIPTGEWLRGRDTDFWLGIGLAVLGGAGGLMVAVAPSSSVLLGLRAVEGIGYLLVVVGGPVVLVRQAPDRFPALAVWGACIPTGLVVSAVAGGGLGAVMGWRGWFAMLAIACAVLAVIVPTHGRHGHASGRAPVWRPGRGRELVGPLLLSAGFSATALTSVAVLSLLPPYLTTRFGVSSVGAGAFTSAVAIASVPGSVVAGVLLHRGVSPLLLGSPGLLCPVLAFVTFDTALSLPVIMGAAVLLLFTVGVGVATAYGVLPQVTRHPDDLPLTNGMMVQLGSAGTLIAPPIFAAFTGLDRWNRVGYLVLLAAVAGVLLLARATSRPHSLATTTRAGSQTGTAAQQKGTR